MKTNLIAFLLLLCSFAQAQNYRYIYDVVYKKDPLLRLQAKKITIWILKKTRSCITLAITLSPILSL